MYLGWCILNNQKKQKQANKKFIMKLNKMYLQIGRKFVHQVNALKKHRNE